MTIEEKKEKLAQVNAAIKAGSKKGSAIDTAGITRYQFYSWSRGEGLKQNQIHKRKRTQPSLVPMTSYATPITHPFHPIPAGVITVFTGSPEQIIEVLRGLR